jgi:hypothetical protein
MTLPVVRTLIATGFMLVAATAHADSLEDYMIQQRNQIDRLRNDIEQNELLRSLAIDDAAEARMADDIARQCQAVLAASPMPEPLRQAKGLPPATVTAYGRVWTCE